MTENDSLSFLFRLCHIKCLIFKFFKGNPHLCVPLFAKLRFANSPLVALSNDMGISLVATSDQGYAPWRAVAF